MAGIKDVSQYKALIDDRAVYMLGTVHQGVLQREKAEDYIEDDDLDIDFGVDTAADVMDTDEMVDIDNNMDEEMDIDIEDDNIELDDSDDEIDLDSDEDEMSFEQFFETAKSMGVTDEAQARAMYINFMANN